MCSPNFLLTHGGDQREYARCYVPMGSICRMIAFLDQAKLIARKGHRISFISTPRNIRRLPKIPTNLSSLTTLVSLSLPHEDNLPDDAEVTSDFKVGQWQLHPLGFCHLRLLIADQMLLKTTIGLRSENGQANRKQDPWFMQPQEAR